MIHHVKPLITVTHASDNSILDTIDLVSDDEDNVSQASTPTRKRTDPFSDHLLAQRQRTMSVTLSPGPLVRVIQTPQAGNSFKQDVGQILPLRSNLRGFDYRRNNPFLNMLFEKHTHIGKGFINLAGIEKFIEAYAPTGMLDHVDKKTIEELCLLSIHP